MNKGFEAGIPGSGGTNPENVVEAGSIDIDDCHFLSAAGQFLCLSFSAKYLPISARFRRSVSSRLS